MALISFKWLIPLAPMLQEFYTEMKSVGRDSEVARILTAFRLNPFEQLGVRFDATPEEIRKQYRKVRSTFTTRFSDISAAAAMPGLSAL